MWLFITGHTVHQINLYDYETASTVIYSVIETTKANALS